MKNVKKNDISSPGMNTYAMMGYMSYKTMQIMLDEEAGDNPWQPWRRQDALAHKSDSPNSLFGHLFSREFMSVFALLTVFAEGMALP